MFSVIKKSSGYIVKNFKTKEKAEAFIESVPFNQTHNYAIFVKRNGILTEI